MMPSHHLAVLVRQQHSEDLLQDVFVNIHTHLATLKDQDKLQYWLYQIATRAYSSSGTMLKEKTGDAR